MSHVPHELAEEFPEHRATIHTLKMANAHFAKLADKYHEVNREIHRHEAAGGDVSDEAMEAMKLQRLRLKDELFAMLQKA
ncbi:MAG TPA: YdcH family protein [Hyphomicrobiaceae bacterium]|nr:YdcH family protein [Hyphomicrobiaceae bacterium]